MRARIKSWEIVDDNLERLVDSERGAVGSVS